MWKLGGPYTSDFLAGLSTSSSSSCGCVAADVLKFATASAAYIRQSWPHPGPGHRAHPPCLVQRNDQREDRSSPSSSLYNTNLTEAAEAAEGPKLKRPKTAASRERPPEARLEGSVGAKARQGLDPVALLLPNFDKWRSENEITSLHVLQHPKGLDQLSIGPCGRVRSRKLVHAHFQPSHDMFLRP